MIAGSIWSSSGSMQQQSRLLILKCNVGFYVFVVVFCLFPTQLLNHRASVGLGCLLLPMGVTGLIGPMQSDFKIYFFMCGFCLNNLKMLPLSGVRVTQ